MIIYLAQPYSHRDPRVRSARFKVAEFMNAFYTQQMEIIYAPIVSTHKMSILYTLPIDAGYWKASNIAFLSASEGLRVLEIPGWGESKGLAAEIEWWEKNKPNVPIQYVSWKEIVHVIANHQDDEGLNPMRYYLQILGAVL